MRVNGQMIHREIAGEHILIPVGETALKVHGMITLTESGLLIWNKLQQECSLEELMDAIRSEYDIDRETALADIQMFLEKLDKLGVLERE